MWVDLESCCQKLTDGSHFTPRYVYDGYPFVTISDVRGEVIDFASAKLISKSDFEKLRENCNPRKGDVLFSKDGTVGKVIEIDFEKEFIVLSSLAIVRPTSEFILPRFLKFLLQSDSVLNQCAKLKTGTALTRIILRNLRTVKIPVPPLNEQRRIALKVEGLFARLDVGVEGLRKVKAQLKRYRQVVLKYAFEGKLTEEWRKTHRDQIEPATKLLQQVKQEKKRRLGEKYEDMPCIDMADLPQLPDGWTWTRIAEVGLIISGQTPKGINNVEGNGETPFYKVGDMNKIGNEKYMTNAEIYLTVDDIRRLKLHVQDKGTVIFPKRGGAIATNKKRVLSSQSAYDLNVMGVFPLLIPHEFFYYWISQIDLKRLSDGSNVPQINHKDIAPLPFPLAPLTEQYAIMNEVETRLSVVEKSEKTVEESLKQAERLRQSILKIAFEGKLVHQDPNDEPVEKLLERIKAEKAKSKDEKDTNRKNKSQLELSTYVK